MIYNRFGFTTFRKIVELDEATLYKGYFRSIPDRKGNSEKVVVTFWAKHPVLAMRYIITTGKHPKTFQGSDLTSVGEKSKVNA